MSDITQIESTITTCLREINGLKNTLAAKELEKQDLLKEVALGIIDVIDTFYRIEEGLIEKGLDKTADGEKIIKRYLVPNKKLIALLNKYGVTELEFPENRLIIGYSKVVDTEPDRERNNDDIIAVVKRGYIRGKELIREAEVIVVRN